MYILLLILVSSKLSRAATKLHEKGDFSRLFEKWEVRVPLCCSRFLRPWASVQHQDLSSVFGVTTDEQHIRPRFIWNGLLQCFGKKALRILLLFLSEGA